jgi:haloalkane dehalogenase
MHYIDEGEGPPIVFVHGNPGWSFEYRKLIRELSENNRCIAADHIGFGLSDKPIDWDYLPQSHAGNFAAFMDSLDLEPAVLVINDWGGPIGLSYALCRPERFRHLLITNTWMWSVRGDPYYRLFSGFAGGQVGRFLIRHFNFFGKVIIRQCMADKKKLHPAIYQHLETRDERKGSWVFPKQIVGASEWLDQLWRQRGSLDEIPKTLFWGMRDIAFRKKELDVWSAQWPEAEVIRAEEAGHYPHEEAAETMTAKLRDIGSR